MEQLFDTVRMSAQDVHLWGIVVVVLAVCVMTWHFTNQNDPRALERAMARKKERQDVADIVSASLQDAAHQGRISNIAWHKYNKKLAHFLGLPDMIPRKPFNERVAIAASRLRLNAMGVNIADGLAKLRRSRPNKQERVRSKLKAKTKA